MQMADTQFGTWSKPQVFCYLGWPWNEDSFVRETHDMEQAIDHANRLRPLFVIICGDLVNTPGHPGQTAEFQRIAELLDEDIPFHVLAGNHDVGNEPTPESLARYREQFGADRYTFREGPILGIVLNSQLIHSPDGAPKEAAAQLAWLRAVFAGHYRRNAHGWDGSLEMVTTGPAGRPLGDDPSGLRIVRIGEQGLDHANFALDQVPESLASH